MSRTGFLFSLVLALWMATVLGVRLHSEVGQREKEEEAEEEVHVHNYVRRTAEAQQQPSPAVGPDDHKIQSLPLLQTIPTDMYAGHLNASPDGDKRIFYWLVAPPTPPARSDVSTPLVLWLNGGPGCSSMDGLFLENGPIRFVKQQDGRWMLEANPYSWHNTPAWVLYVDQPVGTGLSFTKNKAYCKNDGEVNRDFAYFFEEFLLFYQDLFLDVNTKATKRPIYFTGESHAGHYIPSMMDYILRQTNPRIHVSFSGAAIGNGWIDPYYQYAASEAAYGAGLIGLAQKANLDAMEQQCRINLDRHRYNTPVCFQLLDTIINQSYGSSSAFKVSMYDTTKQERKGSARVFPPNHNIVEAYLGGIHPPAHFGTSKNDVLTALHATESIAADQQYRECTDPPYVALSHQDGLGVVPQIVSLLQHGIPMLFYNGIHDLVCNHASTEVALMKLPWEHAGQWSLANRHTWIVGGNPAAYVQEFQNLIYLKILHSGHMVPMDVPEVALQMMQTFVQHGSFQSSSQNLGTKTPPETSC